MIGVGETLDLRAHLVLLRTSCCCHSKDWDFALKCKPNFKNI